MEKENVSPSDEHRTIYEPLKRYIPMINCCYVTQTLFVQCKMGYLEIYSNKPMTKQCMQRCTSIIKTIHLLGTNTPETNGHDKIELYEMRLR